MAGGPRKRVRISSDGASVPSTSSKNAPNLSEILRSFDGKTTTELLLKAAEAHPSISALIQEQYSRQIALEQTQAINVDEFSNSAWEAIKVQYAKLSSSCAAPEAVSQVERDITSICEGCSNNSSYATKMKALKELCQIGANVCSCAEMIKRKGFASVQLLVQMMKRILHLMSEDEWGGEKRSKWVKRLGEVVRLRESSSILTELQDVLDLLEESDDEDEEMGEEEQEDEEHEEHEEGGNDESEDSDDSEDTEAREARDIENY